MGLYAFILYRRFHASGDVAELQLGCEVIDNIIVPDYANHQNALSTQYSAIATVQINVSTINICQMI